MIDCHCHFYSPQFPQEDIPALAGAARAAGVTALVVVPESLSDCHAVLQLSVQQPLVHACAGLHPVQPIHAPDQPYASCRSVQSASEVPPVLDFVRAHAHQLVGIGEVGLDFSPHILQPPPKTQQQQHHHHHDGQRPQSDSADAPPATTPEDLKDVQRAVFAAQIQLANELGLPLNVHSRSAGHHAIDALLAGGARAALLHAFDGKLSHALRGAAAGCFFSVPPSVVRSPQTQKLVKGVPLDSLVLETDAPALGPDKGGVNVPANVAVSAQAIARLKGLPLDQVLRVTTDNALKLFPRLAERGVRGCC